MERRIGTAPWRRKDGGRMFWPIPLFAGLAIFAAAPEAQAQDSIIMNKADSGNKNAVFFQKEKPIIRLRSLEEASGVSENADTPAGQEPIPVNIVIPNAPPVAVTSLSSAEPHQTIYPRRGQWPVHPQLWTTVWIPQWTWERACG